MAEEEVEEKLHTEKDAHGDQRHDDAGKNGEDTMHKADDKEEPQQTEQKPEQCFVRRRCRHRHCAFFPIQKDDECQSIEIRYSSY